MTAYLWVALGAAVGAPTRYLTDRWMRNFFPGRVPVGTLLVNIVGSFILGAVLAGPANPTVTLLAGTGFCGALTTYSTFALENAELLATRQQRMAVMYALVTVVAGLGAAFAGYGAFA
ncbi:fluoride efflux transporter CrcB [Nakamurella antarctica]|uniref:Fluoride-specific ion channel FluC n=1 Tax=Nakamurella antarctica TaxID=1902245 RepID=A0A3G8ZPS2_9ACTN|nr:fluoride efflux transporter CrcB [Nakamurella antarctica]AZI59260.1 fluoride efflux transporter CrcB [Nakamurella antarctica]